MISGLSGTLLSHDALENTISPALDASDAVKFAGIRRRLHAWHAPIAMEMGPACSARAVFDRVAAPLASALGFQTLVIGSENGGVFRGVLEAARRPVAALLVTGWGLDPSAAWRDAVRHGIGSGLRWCFCVTGPVLRVIDSRRTYSRRYAEFDLGLTFAAPDGFTVMWTLLQADAFSPSGSDSAPRLDRAVMLSEKHRAEVRSSLQEGVHDALIHLVTAFALARGARRRPPLPADLLNAIYEESLTVIYRILFLLFAEARGLVPK